MITLLQVLAGPAFIITFTISGVLMGFLADRLDFIFNCHSSNYKHIFAGSQGLDYWARKYIILTFGLCDVLSVIREGLHEKQVVLILPRCVALFSSCCALIGFATHYWQLVVLR